MNKKLTVEQIIELSESLKIHLVSYADPRGHRISRLPYKASAIEKFAVKFTINADTGCWDWVGTKSYVGYGIFQPIASAGKRINTSPHRFIYEYIKGRIPDGNEIDHLCRNRACCNPDHLEAVTHQENRRRAGEMITHCPQGHAYAEFARAGSKKICRICSSLAVQRSMKKRMDVDPEYKTKVAEQSKIRNRKNSAKKRDLLKPNRRRRFSHYSYSE